MKKLLTILSVCAVLSCTLASCSNGKDSSGEYEPYMLTINTETLDESIIQPIYDYFNGFNDDKPELVISSFTPETYINQMKENGTYEDEISTMENNISATHTMWEEKHGANPKISFKNEIKNYTFTKEYLDLAKKYFELTYYDLDSEIEIEEGYELSFNYTVTGESGSEDGNETTCIVKVKDDGWKLVFCHSEALLSYANVSDTNTDETSENSETESE